MKLAIVFLTILISLCFVQGATMPVPYVDGAPSCDGIMCPSHKEIIKDGKCQCGEQDVIRPYSSPSQQPANSIGNYLSSKVTVGSDAPTGESVLLSKYNDKIDTEKYEDCKNSGCFLDDKCYPYGHIIDGDLHIIGFKNIIGKKYCAEEFIVRFSNGQERYTKKDVFVNQKETGVKCNNDFECLTNSCLNGICINQEEEIEKRIEEEVSKEVDKRKNEALNKIESQIEQLNYNQTYSVKIEEIEIPVNKNIMRKMLNWFKGILE